MNKMLERGIEYQRESVTRSEAIKNMEITCQICKCRFHESCERCPVTKAHELTMSAIADNEILDARRREKKERELQLQREKEELERQEELKKENAIQEICAEVTIIHNLIRLGVITLKEVSPVLDSLAVEFLMLKGVSRECAIVEN